jgi:Vitamin K-dependent gamma-carboxylase
MRSVAHEPPRIAALTWANIEHAEGSVRAIAVMRIALGAITLLHLRPFLRDARASVSYDDHFWKPFIGWLPELPPGAWFAMLWIGAAAAVLMAIGLCTRLATATTFAVVAGNLILSQTHFRHNRVFLAILLGGLALLPAGRVLSVDAWWRRRNGRALADTARLWPVWLLRAQVSLVYIASGTSKLLDPDWIGGLVLWDRVVRYQHVLVPTPVPDWGIDLLTSRWLYFIVGPAAVATELFIGIGLWSMRTRLAAIWVALLFHMSIEISASVEVFSYAAIAALAIWVTPVTRDRVVRLPAGRAAGLGLLVRATDWFGRFDVVSTGDGSTGITVEDRDGTVLGGTRALALVGSRLPLTFLFAAPCRLVTVARGGRPRATTGAVQPSEMAT